MSSKYNQGFTLPELLITIVITVIIASIGFLNLFNYQESQNLKLSFQEVVADIRDTQKRAITQDGGSGWGIRFIDSPTVGQRYEIFSGSSYTPSAVNKFYNLRRLVSFGEPFSSSTYDAIFSAISGSLSENKIISLIGSRPNGLVADIIMNKSGLTTGRFENNVQGYWHFDEGMATTTHDASGFNKNGSLYGDAVTICSNPPTAGCHTWRTLSSCKSGGCLDFYAVDADDDYVSTGFILNPAVSDSFSAEAWVKLEEDLGDYQVILQQTGSNGRTWLYRGDGGSSAKLCSDLFLIPGTCSQRALSVNQWIHVVVVIDGSVDVVRLYLQGLLDVTGSGFNYSSATGGMLIGRHANQSFAEGWSGLIDEVRIYNRVLSAQEILNHYNDLK